MRLEHVFDRIRDVDEDADRTAAETSAEQRDEAARLEAEVARVCGTINAATARLVELIARVIETGAWEGHGII